MKLEGVEITKAESIAAGTTLPPPYSGAAAIGPLPAHCRVDGMINRRKGVDGEEFGIGFDIALPDKNAWNVDFMMQGGGGGNGSVAYPTGANYTGDKPALARGFAVASTDTGHKAKTGAFDFSFMRDQQAYLDFAFLAPRPGCRLFPKRSSVDRLQDKRDHITEVCGQRNIARRIWLTRDHPRRR
ncbi:MAG: tannase/feruloyl esterase family alpha/beta hydrolase [Bryobacteraceae bacterium]